MDNTLNSRKKINVKILTSYAENTQTVIFKMFMMFIIQYNQESSFSEGSKLLNRQGCVCKGHWKQSFLKASRLQEVAKCKNTNSRCPFARRPKSRINQDNNQSHCKIPTKVRNCFQDHFQYALIFLRVFERSHFNLRGKNG